jgi:hypothetical protein
MRGSILLIQPLGTVAILLLVPENLLKAALLLAWWGLTFGRLSRDETLLFLFTCLFFSFMDIMSLRQGIFAFSRPDLLGMPYYEFFMWGFYVLHTLRLLNGAAPKGMRLPVWLLTLAFSLCFALIPDQVVLFAATAILLGIGLILFHERLDLAYMGYMVVLGTIMEWSGVLGDEWYYPANPWGSVPLWSITLWGGVGLLLRRLILPILARRNTAGLKY